MIAGKCSRKVAPESMGWMYAKRPRFASSNEVTTRRLDAASWSALLGAYRKEEAKRGRFAYRKEEAKRGRFAYRASWPRV
jgi:hypothetical protein